MREASATELDRWDELVGRFPHNRVFHTLGWVRSLEACTGAKPVFLVVEQDGDVVGCLPGLLSTVGPLRIFGSPREGWQTESMGPVFDPDRISTRELWSASIRFLETRYGVDFIEIVSGQLDHEAMRELGYRGEALFTYRVALFPGDHERAMQQMKRNTRNHLRKAIKMQLVVKTESDESFVNECYDQMREVFTRRGNALPFTAERIRQCFRHMQASGNLLALSVWTSGGLCAATGIFIVDGRELILWCWTHRTESRPLSPTELLTWTAMEHAMDAGCVTFDMTGGGTAKPKYGAVADRTTYRWTRSRYPWLTALRDCAKTGYRWQQSVRGRLARRLQPGRKPAAPHAAGNDALDADE